MLTICNIWYFSKILLVSRNTQKLDPKNSKIIKVSVILDKMTETLMILVILGSKLCIFLLTNSIFEKYKMLCMVSMTDRAQKMSPKIIKQK